ncbi:ABC transporter permease [Paenibacillus agaridevorans]|uniref:ABC transporter permease n=1 Tax=Paenibacillus agaridevorans TaxID=171404 RepID=A0A2R5EN25_9BACL|nr:sugar ABC transporter permease [Paenibacillus agaridevorans]GBG07967.1 ABC transporter permease [Paenibacillus agaridevorans]
MSNSRLFKLRAGPAFRYLVPIFSMYAFTVLLPLLISIYYSVFNEGGTKFIGLQNYILLAKDNDFWFSVKNNIILTIFSVLGQVGFAFLIASFFMTKLLKLEGLHRIAIFLPVVLAPVVTGYLWSLIYNYRMGVLNWLLNLFNADPVLWLDNPNYVLYSVSVPLIWQYIGLYFIIFLAGMQNISKEVLEASEIDGATWFKKTAYVIFPLLKNVMSVALILCITGTLKVFDHIYVMTGGGPGRSSMVMAQYAYNNAFTMSRLSYGSTISIGMLILCAIIVLIMSRWIGGESEK